jgi:hypothetical protein
MEEVEEDRHDSPAISADAVGKRPVRLMLERPAGA